MKTSLIKLASLFAALVVTVNANAALIFQGSTTLSTDVTMTPSQARAAWEAQLHSYGIDDLNGSFGGQPFTSTFGNTYSQTGNGSVISSTGTSIRGDRNGSSHIEFDVDFQAPVNAVGFDVIDNDGGGMILSLTDAITGDITTFNFQSVAGTGHTEFFGVIFEPTTYISSLRVSGTDPGGITTWDDFTTGVGQNAVGVNAPGSIALFGLMLAAAGTLRTRKES